MKQGEKISISIKGVTDTKVDKPASTGGGLKKLAPPKGLSKLPPPGGVKKVEESKVSDLLQLDTPAPSKSDDPLAGLF